MNRSWATVAGRLLCVSLGAFVAACGGGGSGSADLDAGDTTTQPALITASETFAAKPAYGYVVAGTAPQHAKFSGGRFGGNGAWVIRAGQTGVVDFATPADAVRFTARENYVITAAGGGTAKTTPGTRPPVQQALNPPFDSGTLYVRGTELGWAAVAAQAMTETANNVVEVTLPLTTASTGATGEFKIADGGWATVNCGAGANADTITLGAPFTMACGTNPPNIKLTIPEDGNYKFSMNVSDAASPVLTVSKVTGGGGNGGGEEPPPAKNKIRLFVVDAVNGGTAVSQLKEVEMSGATTVDELRRGGESRIVRVEIENTGNSGDIGIEDLTWISNPRFAPATRPISVFYSRPGATYANTRLTIGGQTYPCQPTTGSNFFGCVVQNVPVLPYQTYTIGVTNDDGSTSQIVFNAGDVSQAAYAFAGGAEARLGVPGAGGAALPALPRNANEVILFYKRDDGIYTGWGVHLFPTGSPAWTVWTGAYGYEGVDPQWGAYFRLTLPQVASPPYSASPAAMASFPAELGFIIHKGDEKDPGPDQFIRIAQDGRMVFVSSGNSMVGSSPPSASAARIVGASAHWVDASTLLWKPVAAVTRTELLYSADASIRPGQGGFEGTYTTLQLTATTTPTLANARHLSTHRAWALPAAAVANARAIARAQVVMVGRDVFGDIAQATLVQLPLALDALYPDAATASLGPTYQGGVPTLRVWAPTANTTTGVSVRRYDAAGTLLETVPMALDADSGVWSVTGQAGWDRTFYTFVLRVYSPAVNGIVTNEVTDPYSVSLSTDSVRSQLVNLDDADLKPAGWDTLAKPALAAPEDIVLYELHVRDFSIADASVPAADRGRFTAFDAIGPGGTNGRAHLQQLAQAGLTHVHLLPVFDIATVRENPADRVELDSPVPALCAANPAASGLCPANNALSIRELLAARAAADRTTQEVQQIVEWLRNLDGFNWGYDPYHFGAPEGSYATDPNGAQRVLDFRRMVKGLAEDGLRTVMDVVYNHTNASGQDAKSVLDKLVPGYYHRRNPTTGDVLGDSCCEDTAPEHRMMEKLTTDTLVRWTRDYKVDGFRFDIMGFHPLDSLQRAREAVLAVNPSAYLYGEGWNFGAVVDDSRFVQARQANLDGTGIGSFNDRLRDAVRGGGPFDGGISHVRNQGFASGQYYDPNAENSGADAEKNELLQREDRIRAWLAGGLQDYRLVNRLGNEVTAGSTTDSMNYGGQPTGYTSDPSEAINYIEAHDNETYWDISAYKHPTGTSTADRVRAQLVGMSTVLLAQGIPFLHAGQEVLRSKSMDRNSYDSGDWFNELDWTLQTSKWGVGMPLAADNSGNTAQVTPLLADSTNDHQQADRQRALDLTRELLQIRKSSTLFRLRTAAQINSRVTFANTGPDQVPGVIVMRIDGCTEPALTQPYGAVVVVFNATAQAQTLDLYDSETFVLHPVQAASVDPVVRTASHDSDGFSVPARTTAVFVRTAQSSCAPYPLPLFVRGGFNDWGNGPAPTAPLLFTGGVDYSATVPVAAGSHGFKIADNDWGNTSGGLTNCGGATSGESVLLGQPKIIACNSNSQNLTLPASAAGNYVFSLSAASLTEPVLTVGLAPPLAAPVFVRGGFNDWGNGPAPTAPLVFDGVGKYRAVVPGIAQASYEFKIADNDWGNNTGGTTNCGAATAGAPVTVGQAFPLVCASNSQNMSLAAPAAGSYLFAVDVANPAAPSLTVEQAPYTPTIFLRGGFNDWGNGPAPTWPMTYLGGGVYRYIGVATTFSGEFKIADNDWGGTTGGASNCGTTTQGTPVALGQAFDMICGNSSQNMGLSLPSRGVYTFTLDATNAATPQLTVTGP